MAITAGLKVSPKLVSFSAPAVQGPMFGVVAAVSGTATVLWNDGDLVPSIPTTALDVISDQAVSANQLVGRQVRVLSPTGQNNYGLGVCRAVYGRDTDGAGSPAIVALIQFPFPGGGYVEVAFANVEAVA